jgi:hypothetical protein
LKRQSNPKKYNDNRQWTWQNADSMEGSSIGGCDGGGIEIPKKICLVILFLTPIRVIAESSKEVLFIEYIFF